MIGQRFIESEQYKRFLARGVKGQIPEDFGAVEVMSPAELRSELHLRTYSDLSSFSIDGVPEVGELPAVARVPSIVEAIPMEKVQAELASESSEVTLGSSVPDGTPFLEAGLNFGTTPALQRLPRFGSAIPVTLNLLDEPGQVASLLNRRLSMGIDLGLENEMLLGNFAQTGLIAGITAAGNVIAKGATYRADAICNAVAAVQTLGWYVHPCQVVVHPTTRAAIYTERDTAARPIGVSEMLDDQIDQWVISNKMPIGSALVGDFFEAVGLFINGGLTVEVSRNHQDLLTRSEAELVIGFRTFPWLRQTGALTLVTGL